MADHSALDAHIARIRQLGNLAAKVAPAVAKEVELEIHSQIAAGTAPDGQPWQPTKAGTTPLRGAARALRVRAIGTVIVATLEGHHALHDQGRARGGVRRQVLPSAKMPHPIARAVERVVTREFKQTMGGTAR